MIVDTIANAGLYTGLGQRISKALALLGKEDFRGMKPGKYEVDGTALYYMVQAYQSKPLGQGMWESHRKYLDVQYIVEGVERFGWSLLGRADSSDVPGQTPVGRLPLGRAAFTDLPGRAPLTVTQPYDDAKDAALYEGDGSFLIAVPGTFFLLWPQDAHMPGIAVKDPSPVLKVVVKVLL
jgi:beta-galactosidase beta subunit